MRSHSTQSTNNCSQAKQRLYLHIGSPKTGTTALQYYLYEHRELLRKRGFLYPTGLNLTMAKAHHPIYFAVADTWWNPDFYYDINGHRLDPENYLESYTIDHCERELRYAAANSDNLILSSEGFFDLDDSGVATLSSMVSEFDVSVLIYLRRQDQFIEAMYRHFINDSGARFNMPIEEYVDSEYVQHCNYLQKVEMWAKHFGADNIVVTPYQPKSLDGGDLIFDFLNRLGMCTEDMPPPVRINRSLPNDILSTLSLANRSPWECRTDAADYGRFIRTSFATDGKRYPLLSRTTAIEFLDRFADSNRELARKFLGQTKGELFEDAFLLPTEQSTADRRTVEHHKAVDLLNNSFDQLLNSSEVEYGELILASTALFKAARNSLSQEVEQQAEMHRQLQETKSALESSKQLNESSAQELKQLQETNHRLKLNEKFAHRETERAKEETARVLADAERHRTENAAAVGQVEQLRAELQSALQERDSAFCERHKAWEEAVDATAELERAKEHVGSALAKMEEAQQQARIASSRAQQACEDANIARNQAEQFEQESAAAKLAVKQLQESAKTKAAFVEAEVDRVQTEMATARSQIGQLQRDLEDQRNRATQFAEQLAKAQQQNEKSGNQIQNLLWLAEVQSQQIKESRDKLAVQEIPDTTNPSSTANAESGKAFWRGIASGSRYAMRQPRKTVTALGQACKYLIRQPRKAAVLIVTKPFNALRYAVRQPKKAVLLSFGVRNVDKNQNEHTDDNQQAAA